MRSRIIPIIALALLTLGAPPLSTATENCSGFLAYLAPHIAENLPAEATVFKRLNGGLRTRMISALDSALKLYPPSMIHPGQAHLAKLYILLGLSRDEISSRVQDRLQGFLHYADSLIEKTRLAAEMSKANDEAATTNVQDWLQTWNNLLKRDQEEKRALIGKTDLLDKYQLERIFSHLRGIPTVKPDLNFSGPTAYHESLTAAFILAIDIRDENLAMKIFLHLIRKGDLATAASAAYIARNDEFLFSVALMALSDELAPSNGNFSSSGLGLEIAIEALGGITGPLKKSAQTFLMDISKALPIIYPLAFSNPLAPTGLQASPVRLAKRAKTLVKGRELMEGRAFFTNLESVKLPPLPSTDLAGHAEPLQKLEEKMKAFIRARLEIDPDEKIRLDTFGEFALSHGEYPEAFRNFRRSLNDEGLLQVADGFLRDGHGELAIEVLQFLALLREVRAK